MEEPTTALKRSEVAHGELRVSADVSASLTEMFKITIIILIYK